MQLLKREWRVSWIGECPDSIINKIRLKFQNIHPTLYRKKAASLLVKKYEATPEFQFNKSIRSSEKKIKNNFYFFLNGIIRTVKDKDILSE